MSTPGPDPTTGRRRVWVRLARVVFVLAVVVAVALTIRSSGPEILDALAATRPRAVVAAEMLVLVGLLVTSVAWLRVLAAYGHPLPGREGRGVFFVGQLGKYVPGGVWSIGAHAHLAAAHAVPVRVTAGTSLIFLGLNVATSAVVVGAVSVLGLWRGPWPGVVGPLLVVAGLVALTPPVVTRLAGVVSGRAARLRMSWIEAGRWSGLCLIAWGCYAAAVVALVPDPTLSLLAPAAAAFALSYAVGVAVVVAPAGLGAREVTLVALLAPSTGLGVAAAVAVLVRVLHTVGDLTLALWAGARARSVEQGGRSRPSGVETPVS